MPNVPIQVVTAERDLTADEARSITQEIRQNVAELELKLVRAYQGRAWLALGYDTWDDYIAGEFRSAPLALPREERRAAVQSLRGWGLSTRAIASATGTPQRTIADDVRLSGNRSVIANANDGAAPVTGLDGRELRQPMFTRSTPTPIKSTCPTCGGTGKVAQ